MDGKLDEVTIPSVKDLYNPVLQALRELGGSGSIQEIHDKVVANLELSDEQVAELHNPDKGNQTQLDNRLGWARTALKNYGLVENSRRGVWAFTQEGRKTAQVDPQVVAATVSAKLRQRRASSIEVEEDQDPLIGEGEPISERRKKREREQATAVQKSPTHQPDGQFITVEDLLSTYTSWRDQLLAQLHEMTVSQLERFFLRIFQNEGIDTVDVLGTSSSATIEGTMTSGGFLTFRVEFQFLRVNRQVSAREVEDFRRRARVGGSDKGLLITTGTFTQEATRESERRSPPKIELIDGKQLIDKLKELGLGVSTKRVVVEQVDIDLDWFRGI